MRRLSPLGALLLLPVVGLFLASAPGCKKGEDKGGGDTTTAGGTTGGTTAGKTTGDGGGKKDKVALEGGYDGVIKGRVVFDGKPPEMPVPTALKGHADAKHCLMGSEEEKIQQTWVVNAKNNGVKNVVVWVKPPADKYFKVSDELRKQQPATLDQPHCAFTPHVLGLFPQYFDGKTYQKTGQVLHVKNSAPITHNTRYEGERRKNPPFSQNMPPKDSQKLDLQVQASPIQFKCDIHPWMTAWVLTFDHPYFAVTDDDGGFEIKNAPTGSEVQLVAWHEARQQFLTESRTFKKGENKLEDIKLQAK